jgi:hypothetical protein
MADENSVKKSNIDRGWAWVVMITSYLGIIILSTALYMNGVIYVELLNKYGEGEAKTSLVGALCGGLLSCLGMYICIMYTMEKSVILTIFRIYLKDIIHCTFKYL